MGLAAFNRMRQLEAMKPENIKKEEVTAEVIEQPIIETIAETATEEVKNEIKVETEATPKRRRRTTN